MKMRGKKVLLAILAPAIAFSAAAGTLQLQKDSNTMTVSNGLLKFRISSKGAMITLLQDLESKQNYAASEGGVSGLGKARIYENLRNHDPEESDYKLNVIKNDGNTIAIRATYLAKDRRYKTKGFEFIKTYSLNKSEKRLIYDYMIKAHASTGEFSPFVHNLFKLPQAKSYAFCQTSTGLFCKETSPPKTGGANNFVGGLSEPWGALISPKPATGIIMVNDPDKLHELFFWLGNEQYATIEPLFNKKRFAADAIWKTRMYYMPVSGLKSCHFAGPEYAGGFTSENGKSVLKFVSAVTLGKIKLAVLSNNKKLLEQKINAVAGNVVSIPVALPAGMSQLKVIVASLVHNISASAKLQTGHIKGRQAVYNTGG